jgi:hypothetical protein
MTGGLGERAMAKARQGKPDKLHKTERYKQKLCLGR